MYRYTDLVILLVAFIFSISCFLTNNDYIFLYIILFIGVPAWNVTKTVGPCTGDNPDLEASLDEQYMGAVGYGNDQHYWTDDDWMYDWTQTLMKTADADLPGVFSISWGWSEADQVRYLLLF